MKSTIALAVLSITSPALAANKVDLGPVEWTCPPELTVSLDQATGVFRLKVPSMGLDVESPYYACMSPHCDWGHSRRS